MKLDITAYDKTKQSEFKYHFELSNMILGLSLSVIALGILAHAYKTKKTLMEIPLVFFLD